eukprot:scaffold317687_cov14-Tisochrysis_lutea.AAC.1
MPEENGDNDGGGGRGMMGMMARGVRSSSVGTFMGVMASGGGGTASAGDASHGGAALGPGYASATQNAPILCHCHDHSHVSEQVLVRTGGEEAVNQEASMGCCCADVQQMMFCCIHVDAMVSMDADHDVCLMVRAGGEEAVDQEASMGRPASSTRAQLHVAAGG